MTQDICSLFPAKYIETLAAAAVDNTIALAYSGGVDSRFLAYSALKLGYSLKLLHVKTPLIADDETDGAIEWAQSLGLEVELVKTNPLCDDTLARAGKERCYVCKKRLFTELLSRVPGLILCDGTNASDLKVYRPGRKALLELGVHSPIAEAGIEKSELRRIGAAIGLTDPQQAARPCLITRFPYGVIPLEAELSTVAKVEKAFGESTIGQGVHYRLRYPEAGKPVLHIEAASVPAGVDETAFCEEVLAWAKASFGRELKELKVEAVETLSGFYDQKLSL